MKNEGFFIFTDGLNTNKLFKPMLNSSMSWLFRSEDYTSWSTRWCLTNIQLFCFSEPVHEQKPLMLVLSHSLTSPLSSWAYFCLSVKVINENKWIKKKLIVIEIFFSISQNAKLKSKAMSFKCKSLILQHINNFSQLWCENEWPDSDIT